MPALPEIEKRHLVTELLYIFALQLADENADGQFPGLKLIDKGSNGLE